MSSYFVFDSEGGAEAAVLDRTDISPETVAEIEDALKPVADELEAKKTNVSASRPLEKPHITPVTTIPQLENNVTTVSETMQGKKKASTRVKERVMQFAKKHTHKTNSYGKTALPHVEHTSGIGSEDVIKKEKFKTKAKDKIKKFAKSYIQNINPKGKDHYWWAGALGKLGATVGTAIIAPVAVPAVALSTAAFRVGQYGVERLNKRIHKKRLGEEGYSDWMKQREERYPRGIGRMGRVARGTSAASVLTAIGLAA